MDLSHYDAVIFDMDGVLIDSEPLWKIAMEEVFSSFGSNLTRKDFQKTVGLRLDEVIRFWHHHENWQGISPEEIELKIVARMQDLIRENGEPLPGVIDTLRYLKDRNKMVGLATSSYTVLINTVLEVIGVKDFFDCTHSAENEKYGKPNPAVYLTTANLLNVEPTRCLVIEDSLNGIIAGKAAGMKVVCIPEKTHFPEPKLILADFRYDDMGLFLEDLLNNMNLG